jgi:rfaE bifunctional protein nucleotidyltransferase chain/domain
MKKFINQSDLIKIRKKYRRKIITLCHGTFDLMHMGHIKHMQNAKSDSDILVVSITADKFVNKGPGRPVFTEKLRAESIAALECVDYIYIANSKTAIETINDLQPDFYAKGNDYSNESEDITGNISKEIQAVKNHGGKIKYTNEITFSSSSLLNEYFSYYSDDVKHFVDQFKKKHTLDYLFKAINSLNDLNVLVIGDAIIDEYIYVNPLGQTGKGNIPSVKFESSEKFAGGAIAVANHVSNFVKNVDVVSVIGSNKQDEKFLKSKSEKNVNLYLSNLFDKTLTKSRYIDSDFNRYFEVYSSDELLDLDKSKTIEIENFLSKNISKYDAVIVPDFGNGFINNSIIDIITTKSSFLAVNTQINSGNRGYHAITRYGKANFISLNEPEARLAAHDRSSSIESIASAVVTNMTKSDFISITRGKLGVLNYYKRKKSFYNIPSLAPKVIDRIGAGDAYLSLASILLANKNSIEISSFIGSVAAAIDVQIVCNSKSINKTDLMKFITTLYK